MVTKRFRPSTGKKEEVKRKKEGKTEKERTN
jgi:hypothetical protein